MENAVVVRHISAALWPKIESNKEGNNELNLKLALIIAAVFVCCSPNSKSEDNLTGNWNNSYYDIGPLSIGPSYQTIVWDTIDYATQLQIRSDVIIITKSYVYKFNVNISADSTYCFHYLKSNDTLAILWTQNNNVSYYRYRIVNDSLFVNNLYGDTIRFDSLTPVISGKYAKQ